MYGLCAIEDVHTTNIPQRVHYTCTVCACFCAVRDIYEYDTSSIFVQRTRCSAKCAAFR